MVDGRLTRSRCLYGVLLVCLGVSSGCQAVQVSEMTFVDDLPRELSKVSLHEYHVEPPDILLIDAVRTVRLPKAPLEPRDSLLIRVSGTKPVDVADDDATKEFKRINGVFQVENDGTINLGPEYGSVHVSGMSLEEAKVAIEKHLKGILANPQVSVSLPEAEVKQEITGEHLVRPDGTVSLGIYGKVHVAGLTLSQVRETIELHLADFMLNPQVDVDVYSYNSKVYYVIADGGGYGEEVARIPYTGNETVLDAISQIGGLPVVASKKNVWIARPSPAGSCSDQILPVDWEAITQGGVTDTNYQLMPGDRIYIQADHWISMEGVISKVTAPVERLFGFTLLGNSTVRAIQFGHRGLGVGGSGP